MKKDIKDFVLLTGATGLLGQYLLRDLLRRGHRVAVAIRSNRKATAAQRMEQTMQLWERQAGELLRRPICIEGDITEPNLGFDDDTLSWVSQHVGSVMHSAASLTFQTVGAEPRRTNVEGTNNVLSLCQATNITHMHYISTAYVCGHRETIVREDELDVGQEFRNDYERSKFDAEKAVRDAGFEQTTIYRPVVITGDSTTGYTSTYHGTYLYMKLAKLLGSYVDPSEDGKRHINVRWGLTGREQRNITHVDWNSEIICQLFENEKAHGKTFHMAPSEPITMREAIEYANDFYDVVGIDFNGSKDQPETPLSELEKWLWANIAIYGSYDFMDPTFDCSNLKQFITGPACPKLDKESVQQLIQYAEDDRWGKRKPEPMLPVPLCVETFFAERSLPAEPSGENSSEHTWIGLDLLGPGGGPWLLELDQRGIVSFQRGLPSAKNAPVLKLPVELLKRIDEAPDDSLQFFENAISTTALTESPSAMLLATALTRIAEPEKSPVAM